MSFLIRLFWGAPSPAGASSSSDGETEEPSSLTFEVEDDCIKVLAEGHQPGTNPPVVLLLGSTLPPFKPNPMTKSIGSLAELKAVDRKIRELEEVTKVVPVVTKVIPGENPYDAAWGKVLHLARRTWTCFYGFLDAQQLGGRGSMADTVTVALPSGERVTCAEQVFVDANRWGYHVFGIDEDCYDLSPAYSDSEGNRVAGREVSPEFMTLLERIYRTFGKDPILFRKLTNYLHQGPFNDMMNTVQYELLQSTDKLYLPDQKSLFKDYHLSVADQKLTVMMSGKFPHAAVQQGRKMISGTKQRPLGTFHGIMSINLKTNAAVVRLGALLNRSFPY